MVDNVLMKCYNGHNLQEAGCISTFKGAKDELENTNKYKDILKVGMEFKNYRALCEYLGEDVKQGGRNKELQSNEWNKYFTWTTDGSGYKRTITEVFDNDYSIPKPSKRRTVFNDSITTIILNTLLRSDNPFVKRERHLHTMIGLDNGRFDEYSSNKVARAKYAKRNNHLFFSVDDFFKRTGDNNKKKLVRALTDLQDNYFITYKNSYMLITQDCFGNPSYTPATEDDEDEIRNLIRGLLNKFKYKSVSEVYRYGVTELFYNNLKELINSKFGTIAYYPVISIAYNAGLIEEYLSDNNLMFTSEELKSEILKLNEATVNGIIKIGKKNRNKSDNSETVQFYEDILILTSDPSKEAEAIEEFGKDMIRGFQDIYESLEELTYHTISKTGKADGELSCEVFATDTNGSFDDIFDF